MAVEVSLKVKKSELKRIDDLMKALSPKQNARIWKHGLTRAAAKVEDILGTDPKIILRRGTKPPIKGALTNRHGGTGLIGSFDIDLSKIPRQSSVFTDRVYAPVHEKGLTVTRRAHSRRGKSGKNHTVKSHTAKFPKRPFLAPAAKKGRAFFADIMVAVITEERDRV